MANMGYVHELQSMEKSPHHTEQKAMTKAERDTQVLARLGKKSVLEVNNLHGKISGGSAGLIYGYLFVWLGTIAVFTTMAELASMAPTTGGQYHWIAQLAPPSIRKFMSYIMGWIVICGWMAVLAGSGYVCGTQIEALIQLNNPDYVPQRWEGTLLFWATITVAVLINTVFGQLLPAIESFMLIVHVLGFFAVLIPLVYMAPRKASAHDVFTAFENGGGYPTQASSFFVGLIGTVFAMFGCDSAVHMAEEVKNADVTVPWSMLVTTLLNGAFGWAIVIAVLFVTVDVDAVLASPTGVLGYPYMQIFYDSVGTKGGATAMTVVLLLMTVCGTIAALATASRLIWAFARDRGLPFWRHVSKVQMGSSIPVYAVIIASITACVIGLINIGSAAAFNDVISLSVSSLYASYIITESFLLYHRCTGGIRRRSHSHDTSGPDTLVWGPFHLPGVFGIAVNVFAVAFGCIIFVFSFFPVYYRPGAELMNYSVVMTTAVVVFAVVYYLLWARKEFKGPVVEETMFSVERSVVNMDSKGSRS
ncbi:MAG: hypothetical protein Q9220_006080 [cf. Caloplaca sp. 1 TL-2023]